MAAAVPAFLKAATFITLVFTLAEDYELLSGNFTLSKTSPLTTSGDLIPLLAYRIAMWLCTLQQKPAMANGRLAI